MVSAWTALILSLSHNFLSTPSPEAGKSDKSVTENTSHVSSLSSTTSAPSSNPTACGDIVNNNETVIFNASTVYECLTSVPFNPAVATRFIKYYNDTLQFQSTLAYLKSPPASYQQPPVDLIAGLNRIQEDIDSGSFPNQYSFEASLQNLIYSSHDAHVQLVSGALAAFTFSAPYEIASVSLDGIQLPKVYITDDLFANQTANLSWKPSAIHTINGINATDYLTQFAAVNSIGGLEPHTDWNMLMQSAALDIQGFYETFAGGATFFPGDTITFGFENGTILQPLSYLGIYNSPGDTGPLETGGDFYNFFVLGLYPESYYEEPEATAVPTIAPPTSTAATTSPGATSTGSDDAAYPCGPNATGWGIAAYPCNPDVVQPDLATDGGGFLSGYFLNDSSITVLSMPSFDEFGDAVGTFSSTITEFITRSKQAGLKKVVIDLQQNSGGDDFLAIDAFKQFFPTVEPFGGSRRRAHPMANVLGSTLTSFWETLALNDQDYYDLSADEWVVVDRLNAATGQNFSSWTEYFGPNFTYNGDQFTSIERYNLSSYIFDYEASGGIDVYGYNDDPATSPQPYAAEDIIILTDGLCSSACAVFMEMMHHQEGVRTVAVGGRPSYGPMQSPGQSRGARAYAIDSMDGDIGFAQSVQQVDDPSSPLALPNRTINQDVYITFASVNLRDQIRQNETVPLQFVYEAADCRIFYTPQTWLNYTLLWQYAANAIWTNPKLCVSGSTGFATTAGNASLINTPPTAAPRVSAPSNLTGIITLSGTPDEFPTNVGGKIPDSSHTINSNIGKSCKVDCPGNLHCTSVTLCKDDVIITGNKQCVQSCSSVQMSCNGSGGCSLYGPVKIGPQGKPDLRAGFCVPVVPKFCGLSSSSVNAAAPIDDVDPY